MLEYFTASAKPTFSFSHEEQHTGGTKYPSKVVLRAHHPDTGEVQGELKYFPPRRKGGIATVDGFGFRSGGPARGAHSALMDEMEARHPGSRVVHMDDINEKNKPKPGDPNFNAARDYGLPTDWDHHYPQLPGDIHRGMGVRLESWQANKIHSTEHSAADQAQVLREAVRDGGPGGMHWSADPKKPVHFAERNVRDPRTDIPVILHADTPPRKDIETRPNVLRNKGVWPHDHHAGDAEVPIAKGKPVKITGVSWLPEVEHPEADENGWVHHTFDEPLHRTAMNDYFGAKHERTAGRGKPRRDGGDRGVASGGGDGDPGKAQPAVPGDQPSGDEAASRAVTYHPAVEKDLRALDKPVQRHIMGTIEDLAAGRLNLAQTHTLGSPLSGWSATKASRGHRIVHRNGEDNTLHIGYIGLHDYSKAQRRLLSYFVKGNRDTGMHEDLEQTEHRGDHVLLHRGVGEHDGKDWSGKPYATAEDWHHDASQDRSGYGQWWGPDERMAKFYGDVGGGNGMVVSAWFPKHVLTQHEGHSAFQVPEDHPAEVHRVQVKDGDDWKDLPHTPGMKIQANMSELKPLPHNLYHVTTAKDAVMEDGLKTRDELGQQYGHGFGHGPDDTISLTTHRPTADALLHSMHEYHDVLNGKIKLSELKDKARNGVGAQKPYDYMLKEHPDEHLAEIDSGHVTEHRFHVLGEQPKGWTPKDKGMTNGDGVTAHLAWDHPLSDAEKIRHRSDVYKNFAWGRQAEGGHMNPLFMGNDPAEFAKKDPSQFALVHTIATSGATGYQMNNRTEGTDAGEWRVRSGDDVNVIRHHTLQDIPPREAALGERHIHDNALAYAQQETRKEHPDLRMELPPTEAGATQHLQKMLTELGHPGADRAFVIRQPDMAASSQVVTNEDDDPGVAIHPRRWDFGTLAHEAAHIAHAHDERRGLLDPLDREHHHGPAYAAHYSRAVATFAPQYVADDLSRLYNKTRRQLRNDPSMLTWTPKQAAHTAPTSRVFGPTFGLDHRLFEGEHLKPEVRTAVLSRLGPVLEPLLGQSWETFTRVYLAGSEASEWTSATLEGNGDFDTLIGIDYSHARDMHTTLEGLDDADITDLVNTALRTVYNDPSFWFVVKDDAWHPDQNFNPKSLPSRTSAARPEAPEGYVAVGPFEVTGYVNANSYDITKIKPYAAYNISDDVWAVRPPHLPDWGIDKLPEGGANLLAEAEGYASVIEAIEQMPEPYQTQQGKALWHHLHTDRGRAFSDDGEGWMDPGNLIEKALVEWGLWDKLVEWQYGTQKTAVKRITFEHMDKSAAQNPRTIKRGVILDGHPTDFSKEPWEGGGWDNDAAHRIASGTATHHDILKHLDTNHVGHFWYHPDHADLEDAQSFANPGEPLTNWLDMPDEHNHRIGGEVGVVLEAHHPHDWDPTDQEPTSPLMGNSYLPDHTHLKLHKLHYTPDGGENWHTIPLEHHNIEAHTDGPGEQKTASAGEYCETCNTHHDKPFDEDDHFRSYTDWDKVYPRLPKDIHRGIAVQLPPDDHEAVHDASRPEAERAHAAVQLAALKPLGMHWSAGGAEMAGRIASDQAEQFTPRERRNTTHILLHADRPDREHIETDINRLVKHDVISQHSGNPEAEVPLKEGAPVHAWGVSWRHHDEPDWHYHEFDEPITKHAVQSGGLDLPQEQHDALEAEPDSAYKRKTLELAKKPVAGTHIWRGEVRNGDPAESMRQSGVGMHWTVNPSALLHPYTHEEGDRNIVWHGEIEHPEQGVPRTHQMWQGQHRSMDSEAEVRFKPGTQVKVHGYWMKDPDHPDPGYLVPRFPEHTGPGWSYHSVGEHATVSHKPRTDLIDYGDVGIPKDAKIIDITAYFKTAEDDDTDYRMQHRPPDADYGAPLHDLETFMPDVYTHPQYYGDRNDPSVQEAHRVIQRTKGRPDAKVKVYRAVPADYADQGFRPGDWVTTSKEYAKLHGTHNKDSKHDWPVVSTTVRADELHNSGDDPREYGYNGEHKPMGMVSFKGGYHEEIRHDAQGKIVRVKRRAPKTAMPAKNHPPTEDFSHEIHDLDWDDNDHAKQEQDWPGWNHKILIGKVKGQLAGHIVYSENPHGTAISVGKMETRDKERGKGVASAMQDALAEEHPTHWINHGSRTGPGVQWWNSYDDPAEHRNIHNHPHEQWMDHFDIGQEHDDPDRVFGENDRPTPEGGLKFEHVKGKEAYIGGVVKWRPPHGQEDHDTVHDKTNYEHDTRADTLLNAASEQNALGHGQFHGDRYDAWDHAHQLAAEARKTHKGPLTSFIMRKDQDDEYPAISVQDHQPGAELHAGAQTHLDTEYHYHPVHDRIARTAIKITDYFGVAA